MVIALVLSVFLALLALGADVDEEHIRVPISQRARNRALRPQASTPVNPANRHSGPCSFFETSANATECLAFSPFDNGLYFGQVFIGSDPVQAFNVGLTSVFGDFWILSVNEAAPQSSAWVPAASESGHRTGVSSIVWGEFGTVGIPCDWWNETATFGDLNVTGILVGAADVSENPIPAEDPVVRGYLGMGWPAYSVSHSPPFLYMAYDQGLIKNRIYGFFAGSGEDNSTDGELTLGSIDSSRYSGTLNYHNVTPDDGIYNLFNINSTRLTVEGKSGNYFAGTTMSLTVDIGTSFLALPSWIVSDIVDIVNGTLLPNFTTYTGGFSIPCENLDKAPAITLGIDDINYTLPGSVWTHRDDSLAETGVPCFAELYAVDSSDDDSLGTLGGTFLRQYYSVFDFDNHRVGFAQSVAANTTSKTNSASRKSAFTASVTAGGMCLLVLVAM